MGLAAYGSNVPDFRSIISDDALWLNTSGSNPHRNSVFPARKRLSDFVNTALNSNPDFKANIARTLQDEFESRFLSSILNYLDQYIDKLGDPSLVNAILLSGGCSLNCAAVGKLVNILHNKNLAHIDVFVSPVPYDAGLSIGSIINFFSEKSPKQLSTKGLSPYLGHTYSKLELLNSLRSSRLQTEVLDIPFVVEQLAQGRIMAIFNGRSESGRRALCNRSIIADPRNPNIREIINMRVKHRPLFRPFAPVILEEYVKDWFLYDIRSPYMSHAIPFLDSKLSDVPSVVHKDGTGRLQTINSEQNPWMATLLESWKEFTGCPILINTSFNDNEPIVETLANALFCFENTRIDYLLLPELNKIVLNKNLDR